jgi:hypothetical protein
MPRGKKSAASLELSPMMPGAGRPEPPASLSPVEARCWRDVVDSLPSFWVDTAGQLVLRRLAIQIAFCESIEQQMRDLLLQAGALDDAKLTALTGIHIQVSKSVTYLLTQLRATPKARILPRDQRMEPSRREPESRPWEIRAETGDAIQ